MSTFSFKNADRGNINVPNIEQPSQMGYECFPKVIPDRFPSPIKKFWEFEKNKPMDFNARNPSTSSLPMPNINQRYYHPNHRPHSLGVSLIHMLLLFLIYLFYSQYKHFGLIFFRFSKLLHFLIVLI